MSVGQLPRSSEGGAKAIGQLGIRETAAKINISVGPEDERAVRVLRFLSEPEVGAIAPEGPSYGKVKEGDVIVAVGVDIRSTCRLTTSSNL